MRNLRLSVIGLFFIVLTLAPHSLPQQGSICYLIPTDKYIFIETWTTWDVEVLEGRWTLHIDFPTYLYYGGKLEIRESDPQIATKPTFLTLWGDGISLRVVNDSGGGTASDIRGVYELPFRPKDNEYFQLLRIEPDGTVVTRFHGKQLTLKQNESWHITTEPQIKQVFSGTIKESFTHTIRNFGLLSKRDIRFGDFGDLELNLGNSIERVIDQNSNTYIDDQEITFALDRWIQQAPLPEAANQTLDDCGILRMLHFWITRNPAW